MALLDAAAHAARDHIAAVATFDHGTGGAARFAAALVADHASALGLPVTIGRAGAGSTEATWRAARWTFLRGVAREKRASVVTAHTRDDQVETVVIRVLRGAGARGLAGLYADSDIVRPFLDVPRDVIAAYVRDRSIPIAEDPSNLSRVHLRNRLRLDLLPALRRAQPGLEDAMLDVARRAADWRRRVETLVRERCPVHRTERGCAVAAADLAGYDPESLAVLWPAIAARAGVTLDWRGTSRLVAFTNGGRLGASIQLSGGVEVVRTRLLFVFRSLDVGRRR